MKSVFEVYSTEKEREAISRRRILFLAGTILFECPLNGGSDTRASAREYYYEYAKSLRKNFESSAFWVKISHGDSRKGNRYVTDLSKRKLFYLHWRKAKRQVRKGILNEP